MTQEARIPFSIAANMEQFLLGIAVEEAASTSSKDKAFAKIESEIKKVQSNLRESYDKLVPNVMVLDVDVFTNLIINRIVQNPEKFLDEFSSIRIQRDWGSKTSPEYIALKTRIQRLVNLYHTELLNSQRSTNPIVDLNTEAKKLFSRVRNIENDVAARTLGIGFAKNIRQVFGNKAVLAAVDPKLGSSKTTFVFFSSSFLSIGAGLREKVYNPLIKYIRTRLLGGEIETRSDIKIGEIVNLGHATLVNELGAYVNSPAFAKSLFTVAKGGSTKFASTELVQAASFFKKESRIIENKIEVTKEFTSTSEGFGVLLALGVTFTNLEDAVINSDRGRRYEGPTARTIGDIKTKPQTPKERERLANTLLRSVLRLNPLLGRSGRNLQEFVRDAMVGLITDKPTASLKYHSKKSKRSTKTYYAPKKDARYTPKSYRGPVVSEVALQSARVIDSSLTGLQNLLNANLVQQVKQNMGDGSRRDVLNLRTGQFAESVKVERLSESRQGMITAFYTYMKNPYATFSQGGKQSSPASRDPKLLISKSIREIAQQQVANRLRAVSI